MFVKMKTKLNIGVTFPRKILITFIKSFKSLFESKAKVLSNIPPNTFYSFFETKFSWYQTKRRSNIHPNDFKSSSVTKFSLLNSKQRSNIRPKNIDHFLRKFSLRSKNKIIM